MALPRGVAASLWLDRCSMAIKKSQKTGKDARWYADRRHNYEAVTELIYDTPGWYYCDPETYYRDLFPKGFLQDKGCPNEDGRPNLICVEDTGIEIPVLDAEGNPRLCKDGTPQVKHKMNRYTITDDHELLREITNEAVRKNTYLFVAPVSNFGKSRGSATARYLHAMQIDLDYVGPQQVRNLFRQMDGGVLPHANYVVCSGTGLHVVYRFDKPVPLMTRYIPALQELKQLLTDLVWNKYTSGEDIEKRQHQGIFQAFRMVGTPTKLNGECGNAGIKQGSYVAEAFSHDETPPATLKYLLSFMAKYKRRKGSELEILEEISEELRPTTPLAEAREKWPEWAEARIDRGEPRRGWLFGEVAYYDCLDAIYGLASVGHRYWCVFYLAVMANKCGVPWEVLEEDAYGLVGFLDAMTDEPKNRFTAADVSAALEAFEGGVAGGRSRHYRKPWLERKSGISWETRGARRRPEEQRLPLDVHLAGARAIRDEKQKKSGTHWWDTGNRDGAPTKEMLVWRAAIENPGASHSEIARIAGVSRPTVIKWLSVENWRDQYEHNVRFEEDEDYRENFIREVEAEWEEERERMEREYYAPGGGFDMDILYEVASCPWKTHEEIASLFGLSNPGDVQKTIDMNQDAYRRILLETDDERIKLKTAGKEASGEYHLI